MRAVLMPRACSPSRKTLPRYKTLARDLRKGSKERLERTRYSPHPSGDASRPCVPVRAHRRAIFVYDRTILYQSDVGRRPPPDPHFEGGPTRLFDYLIYGPNSQNTIVDVEQEAGVEQMLNEEPKAGVLVDQMAALYQRGGDRDWIRPEGWVECDFDSNPEAFKRTVAYLKKKKAYPPRELELFVFEEDLQTGRTTHCYHPTQHGKSRKACTLLLDPDGPLNDFAPGFYLLGGRRMRDLGTFSLVCQAVDLFMGDQEDVDSSNRQRTTDQFGKVAVLGPYPALDEHGSFSGRLKVKCLLLSGFENVGDLFSFGRLFQPLAADERGAMVPSAEMLRDLVDDVKRMGAADLPFESPQTIGTLESFERTLREWEGRYDRFAWKCNNGTPEADEFRAKMRTLCKCLFEMALYFRRYAGPGRKVPVAQVHGEVGSAANPVSDSLRGKFAKATPSGVRIVKTAGPGGVDTNTFPADYVIQPEGTLTNMSQANARCVEMILRSFDRFERKYVDNVFALGSPFRKIDGTGFWPSLTDNENPWNGNGALTETTLFGMLYGDLAGTNGFVARNSVFGNGSYCVQVASIQIIRCVQTILPMIYKSRPAWANADGEFDNIHT